MVTFLFLMARHKANTFVVGYICYQNYRLQAFLLKTSDLSFPRQSKPHAHYETTAPLTI